MMRIVLASLALAMLGCGAGLMPMEDADTKYEVFSALLRHYYDETVYVARETTTTANRLFTSETLALTFEVVDVDTIESFLEANEEPKEVRRSFDDDIGVRMYWPDLPRQEPSRSRRYVTLSDVGLNQSRTEALVCFSEMCGNLCGYFRCALLGRDEGSVWVFHEAQLLAVS